MAKFLTGNKLNLELEMLLEKAEKSIILISPFIKLHARYESALKAKIKNPNIAVTIVFGKNEEDLSKSMTETDFNFFKQFPNIEIRFEKRLHAKYYANESTAILTSMNLYSFSQDNNIEAGIIANTSSFASVASSLIIGGSNDDIDEDAWKYFSRVIDQSELLFKRTPEFESTMLGLSKKFKSSNTEVDQLTEFFSGISRKKIFEKVQEKKVLGYCIRSGKEIPFNVERPLSDSAFKSWNYFKDYDFPEKYCHFSGEPSNGETSYGKPILRKNWNEARKKNNF